MGLFDEVLSSVTGGGQTATAAPDNSTLHAAMQLVNNYPGGLSGLVQNFHEKGMGGVVSSWVGTGQNQPISGDQLQAALGNEHVQAFAKAAGIDTSAAGGQLAQLLPSIIDKLTPNGQVPANNDLLNEGLSFLKSRMGA